MKVKIEITPYVINGEERKVGNDQRLIVENVWNRNNFVSLNINGQTIVVHDKDLIKAISNATNNDR